MNLLPPAGSEEAKEQKTDLVAGRSYKVVFKTKEYFESTKRKCFYPWVEVLICHPSIICQWTNLAVQITFEVVNPNEHYHIPLLISPYSFTTYRGS